MLILLVFQIGMVCPGNDMKWGSSYSDFCPSPNRRSAPLRATPRSWKQENIWENVSHHSNLSERSEFYNSNGVVRVKNLRGFPCCPDIRQSIVTQVVKWFFAVWTNAMWNEMQLKKPKRWWQTHTLTATFLAGWEKKETTLRKLIKLTKKTTLRKLTKKSKETKMATLTGAVWFQQYGAPFALETSTDATLQLQLISATPRLIAMGPILLPVVALTDC